MKISQEQKEIMISFLSNNKRIVTGKTTPSFSIVDIRRKWQQLAEQLNSVGGPNKTWMKWRKTWHDIYGRVKAKLGAKDENFSKWDEEILNNFIKPATVEVSRCNLSPSCSEKDSIEDEEVSLASSIPISAPLIPIPAWSIPIPALPNPTSALPIPISASSTFIPARSIPVPAPSTPRLPSPPNKSKRKAEYSREDYSQYFREKLEEKKNYYEAKLKILEKQTKVLEDQHQIKLELLQLKKKKFKC